MMSARSSPLQRPVSRVFVGFTILLAWLSEMLPWGQSPWVPDLVALVLVFWNIHQPRKVGIGVAFLVGLLVDVHASSLLGERALTYSLLSFGAISLHRRVLWFATLGQMLHVGLLMLSAVTVSWLIRAALGAAEASWSIWLAPVASTLLWPVADRLLLWPQRRPLDRDENRPI
jgi:rod shape-determining protein MreD